ncbi:MAG: 3'-5' exonuclease [Chitinophagales bacterium]
MNLFESVNTNLPFRLDLKRPIAFFDLETTGVDFIKDRIVEISVIRIDPDQTQTIKTMRLNPTIPIPIEASQVHGIYDEDVITAPTFKEKAQELFDLMNPCDWAGFNSNRFDVPLLLEEFIRAGFWLDIESRNLIDVHRIFTLMEKRDLTAAYKFYCNKDLVGAHGAEADTKATMEVMLAQIQRYPEHLKNDMRHLHEFSNEERFLDSGRRFIYTNGKPHFNFGKHKGKPVEVVLREEPSYYNWMLNGDFPEHTKRKLREIKESR